MKNQETRINIRPGRVLPALLLIIAILFWSATGVTAASEPQLRVATGIPPMGYLLERIGGQRLDITVLLPAGSDPHTFEPSPGQVTRLAQGELYFSLNMPFERLLLQKTAASRLQVIEVGRGIEKRLLPEHHHDDHHDDHHSDYHHHDDDHDNDHHDHAHPDDHHHAHAHATGEPDPHIWLGPEELPIIAAHIMTALAEADPRGTELYLDNYQELKEELEELHTANTTLLAPLAGRTVYVYHPAFGYFTAAYGLEQRAVEIGGKSPTPRQLQDLIRQARQDNVRVIFVQPQFDRQSAATIARAIDGEVVALDPLAADVVTNLEKMADHIHRALIPEADDHQENQ